jgi:hypothetical protein
MISFRNYFPTHIVDTIYQYEIDTEARTFVV